MSRLRIAIPTQLFGEDLRQSILAAAEARADGIHMDARSEVKASALSETGRRQLLHYLKEVELRVASLGFPTRRSYYEPEQLDARVQATKAAMELANQLRAPILTVRIGRIPDDPASDQYAILTQVLNDLARHGNRVGTTLAVTPSRDSSEQLSQLIADVTDGPMGIDFDPASFVMSGQSPSEAFRAIHDHVVHVRARDAVRDMNGDAQEVVLGRGEVEWDELLALIDEAEFQSWITVDRTTGDDRSGDAVRAIQYLRNVAAG